LRNENIDVINYSSNPVLYIQRALSPAKVSNIVLDESRRRAAVYLAPDQVSLAIGKGGLNVKLAGLLTGFEIDIFRDEAFGQEEEDVELDEFTDEIDEWILDRFKAIGCDTAKMVLELTPEEIQRRTGLDPDLVEEVVAVLRKEFEEEA
jgi:N utilization substance protein A